MITVSLGNLQNVSQIYLAVACLPTSSLKILVTQKAPTPKNSLYYSNPHKEPGAQQPKT